MAQEICDGRDNNCNGATDEGFPDSDNDGRADCADCRPADPTTWEAPPEVTNVQAVLQDGGRYFLWDDLSLASGSVMYDVFSGMRAKSPPRRRPWATVSISLCADATPAAPARTEARMRIRPPARAHWHAP